MTTRAEGSDLDGQQAALATISDEFAKVAAAGAHPGEALRLRISGAGSFGVSSRERIKADVERLALYGSVALVALLWLAFASLRSLAIAWLPVATGVLAGIACVSLGFGQVHGMTLGFGTTLIGEAVDYAIYYLIQTSTQNRPGTGATRWLRESWPTVRLGLFTSLIGFAALLFAGFPGLAQLGVFSIAGLAAAAATTRFVFPAIVPDASRPSDLRRRLARFMHRLAHALPKMRRSFVWLCALAAADLLALPSPWHGELADLSPITAAELKLDAALRADVGAPDAGTLIVVSAANQAGALAAAEHVGTRLDGLVRAGVLGGYDSPARYLPSPATQQARLAALPDAATLSARLAEATAGGALGALRLEPFIDDVQNARRQAPFDRAALEGTPLATAVDALLVHGDGARPWRALLNLQPSSAKAIDAEAVRAAMAGIPGAQLVAIKPELDAIYSRYLHRAMWQAALGGLAVVVLLALSLKSLRRLLAVVQPLAAATLVVLATLAASGAALGILHLVGFLLVAAIGSNYALFFDHLRRQREVDEDTLASLLLANLATVLSFGLLASSRIAALQAIGEVVAPGTLLCLVFSAAFIVRPDAATYGKIESS
jgi:predicted exporter